MKALHVPIRTQARIRDFFFALNSKPSSVFLVEHDCLRNFPINAAALLKLRRNCSFGLELSSMRRPLVYKCPVTDIDVISGISCDDHVHELIARSWLLVDCPVCGTTHPMHLREAREPADIKLLPNFAR